MRPAARPPVTVRPPRDFFPQKVTYWHRPHWLAPFWSLEPGCTQVGFAAVHCGYLLCCRYTMTKSSAVLFILIFSLIFKLEELVSPTSPPTVLSLQNCRCSG